MVIVLDQQWGLPRQWNCQRRAWICSVRGKHVCTAVGISSTINPYVGGLSVVGGASEHTTPGGWGRSR